MDVKSLSPVSVLLNIFTQLLPRNGDWIDDFPDLVSRKEKKEPPPTDLQDLCEMILKVAKCRQHVVLAIDALDECTENREELLSLLRDLTLKGVPVFVTSRREQDIAKVLHDALPMYLGDLKDQVEADMRAYINAELQKRSEQARFTIELKEKIKETLVKGADGM